MVSDGLFHDVSPFSTPCAHLAVRLDVRLGSLPNATPLDVDPLRRASEKIGNRLASAMGDPTTYQSSSFRMEE
jgi:hypothetical protein